MNRWIGMGRLTSDPDVRASQNGDMQIARYTLAVDRRTKEKQTDFIRCVCFGKSAEWAEKWLKKGVKVVVSAHVQTGSYTDKDGNKRSTTDFVIDEQEFAESKKAAEENTETKPEPKDDGFVNAPDDIDDLPFA